MRRFREPTEDHRSQLTEDGQVIVMPFRTRNAARTRPSNRRPGLPTHVVPRVVAWLVAVGLGVPLLLVAPAEPSARAAGGGPPVEAPQTPELAALRQRAAEVQRSLMAATAAYEAANARLAQAVTRALSQRQRAEAARLRVMDSRERVDALLRSAYKNGGASPGLSLLLAPSDQDAESLLDGVTYLSQVTRRDQDVLRDHMAARRVADELQQAAEQAAAEATSQERALGTQVAALRAQATQAQSELETLMRRLVAEQQARERAAKLARERALREQARRLAAARSAAQAAAARSAAQAAAARTAAARAAAAQAAAAAARATAARAATPAPCGDASADSATAWSNYPNGLIPTAALCALSVPGHLLRADAAQAFERLAAAYRQALDRSLCVSDSYRSYEAQVRVYGEKPSLAAVPGTSNHGWGIAVDLCGGLQRFGTPDQAWMRANAGRYGWQHPAWAEPGGSRPEPWHWEYGNIS
jgi:peptidoglycan hydrolase CwlO-like protein